MPGPAPRLAGATPRVDRQTSRPRQRIQVLQLPEAHLAVHGEPQAAGTLPRSGVSSRRWDRG
jgi:hypothetical protein